MLTIVHRLIDSARAAWAAIRRAFSGAPEVPLTKAEPPQTPVVNTEPNKAVTQPAEVKKPRAKRSAAAQEVAGMADLLDSLDDTFRSLRLPFGKWSWISKSNVVGLKKLGVHVVHPSYLNDPSSMRHSSVPAGTILPAMLAVSFGHSRFDDEDKVYASIVFAIKIRTLPSGVSKCQGQHYQFGAGFRLGDQGDGKSVFWVCGHMTVLSDGSLHLHQEFRPRTHTVRLRSPSSRRAFGPTATFSTQSWGKSSMAEMYEHDGKTNAELICKQQFANAMHWWLKRGDNWNVSVSKNGERITFAIPKELTSKFFKDRIKVTNDSGATKRIIHYVNEHTRDLGDKTATVKPHIRGMSDFTWKGYQCRVTAPSFNGYLTTGFTLAADGPDDEDPPLPAGYMDASKLGLVLARMEDGQTPRMVG